MAEKWRVFLRYVNGEKQYNVGRYTRQGRYPGAIQYKGPCYIPTGIRQRITNIN